MLYCPHGQLLGMAFREQLQAVDDPQKWEQGDMFVIQVLEGETQEDQKFMVLHDYITHLRLSWPP